MSPCLKAIDNEIQDFQKEKQFGLNQIDVTVTLRMHQMEYLHKRKLPTDLGEAGRCTLNPRPLP